MSPNIRRQVQLFGISGGVISILLALLLLTLTDHATLYAAPIQVHHTAIRQTGTITGQVTAEDSGAPLAGVEIVAFSREVSGSQQAASTSTDTAGRYQLTGLLAGTHKVCFGPFRIDERYLSECYDNQSLDNDEEQLVTVNVGEVVPNINAVLTLGGMIQGRVTSGRTGEPLPNIPVYAVADGYDRSATTDTNGFYTITTLPTNNYRVSFNVGGNEEYAWEYYDNQASEENSTPISVTSGITTSGIDADLTFILNITGRIAYEGTYQRDYSLDIRVYDDTGEEVQMHLAPHGEYSITALPPGAYRIRFGEDEFINEYYSDSPTFEGATWVTVTENVVASNINVSLTVRPGSDILLATATTRPDAILAARLGSFSPLYSLDGGQSWHTFTTKPTEYFQDVRHIATAPKEDDDEPVRFLLAPTGPNASASVGLYRSADEGASWASYTPPSDPRCDEGSHGVIEEIASSAANPLRHYLLAHCVKTIFSLEPTYRFYFTLFTSEDGGVNWQAVTLPYSNDAPSFFPYLAYSLQPSPAESALLYANADRYEQTHLWWRSDNDGQSWITETFTATALALDWTDASKLYRVEEQEGNSVFRYTGKRSTNSGANWENWPQQPCRTSFLQLLTLPMTNSLLMLCNQGLYHSNNGGDSWELLTTETGGELSVHYGDHDLILWARGAKLYGSRDQGTTWQDLGGWQDAYLPSAHRP